MTKPKTPNTEPKHFNAILLGGGQPVLGDYRTTLPKGTVVLQRAGLGEYFQLHEGHFWLFRNGQPWRDFGAPIRAPGEVRERRDGMQPRAKGRRVNDHNGDSGGQGRTIYAN